MPANLPPQYFEVEKRYREAKSIPEKVTLLEEMLAIMPKHKGTEKLQKELKTKISKLKKQPSKKSHASKRGLIDFVPKEGAGQVVLIGHPNTGKSLLLSSLTNASPEVAPYPYTTRLTQSGMMEYENIKIQLVDTPPITSSFMENWMPSIIRSADAALLITDLSSSEPIEQIEDIINVLNKYNIKLIGKMSDDTKNEVKLSKKTTIVCNKNDISQSSETFKIICDLYKDKFPLISVSTVERKNFDQLKNEVYKILDIVRVYSKIPGKKADSNEPFVFKKGTTLIDVARSVHKDFEQNLKFARIWGSGKYDGQKVQKDYIVEDEDIIEFHI